jgi:hypothetical protein
MDMTTHHSMTTHEMMRKMSPMISQMHTMMRDMSLLMEQRQTMGQLQMQEMAALMDDMSQAMHQMSEKIRAGDMEQETLADLDKKMQDMNERMQALQAE